MGKKKGTIQTTAVVNGLTIGIHEDKISFTSLSLTGDDNELISEIIQSESPVSLTISLQGKADKKFPPVEVQGSLKKYTINKTCDSPDIKGIQFSTNQVQQLTNYIRSEEEIDLKLTQLQQELGFEED